jgi:hypothetical protein
LPAERYGDCAAKHGHFEWMTQQNISEKDKKTSLLESEKLVKIISKSAERYCTPVIPNPH